MVAEGVEFLINSVFTVDNQSLVLGNVICLPEIFKDRGVGSFKSIGKRFVSNVLVMTILTGQQIESSLTVARVDALLALDFNIAKEDASFLVEVVIDKWTKCFFGRGNGFEAANSTTEPNHND